MEHVDTVVVGGGIVGIAVARELSRRRPGSVLVLEAEDRLAAHQSGHNSGVLHSGIYYPPGSLKADFCRRGAAATRALAREHGIQYRDVGKLLVARTPEELPGMRALAERAAVHGIEAEVFDGAELRRREPAVRGVGALWLPGTGIIDYARVTRALAGELAAAGGEVRTRARVVGIAEDADGVTFTLPDGAVRARRAVVCAGIQADRLARAAGLDVDFAMVPFRGEYYDVRVEKTNLVSAMIYPIPDPDLPFLGVHLTPTIDSGLTLGPNAVLGLARAGYPRLSVDARDAWDIAAFPGMWRVARRHWRTGAAELRDSLSRRGYLARCRSYAPDLELGDLVPREAGIRAQAVLRDGSFVHDFLIRDTRRTLHVVNAPSPAATSALPIAAYVADRLTGG